MSSTQERKHEEQKNNKDFAIIVNGRQKVVSQKELTFAKVVALAFDNPPTGPNIVFTVTYRRGRATSRKGRWSRERPSKSRKG